MTEEKLRLEIQIEVQKALSSLKTVSQDLKKLGQDVKTLGPSSEQTKAVLANLNKEIQSATQFARLMGSEVQGLREKQQALEAAMRQLIDQGLDPQGEQLQDLKRQYEETAQKLEQLGEGANTLETKIGALAQSGAFAAMARQISGFAIEAVTAFAQAEQSVKRLEMAFAMRGDTAGAHRLAEFASQLQALTGASDDYVKQLAAELAMQGKSEAQIRQILTVAADLSAVTGEELAGSVQELTATLSGMVGRIGRLIPQLKDLTEEELKAGKAIELVGSLYAGAAQSMSGTSAVAFKRMQESVGDLMEAMGEGLAPLLTMAANAIGTVASAAAQAGPVLKGVLAFSIAAVSAALTVLAAKTALSAAAHWTKFAAVMAVNKALAMLNPLLLAGIAAVAAGTAAVVAYANSQSKAAQAMAQTGEASRSSSSSFRDTSQAIDQARAALEAYKASLKDKSMAELNATLVTLRSNLAALHAEKVKDAATRALLSQTQAQIAIVERLIQEKKDEIAGKWKEQWAETYERFQAQAKGPEAEIEYERKKKLEEAAAAYIGTLNQKTIDEINAYYNARRKQVIESLALTEREQLARLTQTRIDDLEVERDRALASFRGSEESRARIAAYYTELIASTRIEEERKAARERIEQELKVTEFEARLTETRVDDLRVQMNRELALFEGTEEQKARLAAWYAEQIRKTEEEEAKKAAETRIEEAKRAFEESRRLAARQGQWGAYAAKTFQTQAASSEVGKMAGFAGTFAIDPITMAIEAIVEFALSVENVQKVLNPFKTILEGARKLLEPLLNNALQPIVDVLLQIGRSLAQTLAPFLSQTALFLRILSSALQIALVPARLIGRAFEWLNNQVIVPFGNAVINIVNGVIRTINWVLGWVGVSIPYLEKLKTTDQIVQEQEEIRKKMERISEEMDRVRESFSQRRREIEDAYQKNIASLRKLLEVGALGEAEYEARVAAANAQKEAGLAQLAAAEAAQLATLQSIYNQLSQGINVKIVGTVDQLSSGGSQPTRAQTALSSGFNPYNLVGAALGAGLGSFLGPVGTVAGAALGAQAGGYIKKAADFVGDATRKAGKTVKKLFSWDVGAWRIPQDMFGQVHEGEMIVPRTFAEGIRRGELVLKNPSTSTPEVVNITLYVSGSVVTQDELADSILLAMAKKKRRNTLPVGAIGAYA